MQAETIAIACRDGYRLATSWYASAQPPRCKLLIVPAMGMHQRFYRPLAEWLAAQGCLAVSFDYRGTGASRQGSLRGFPADIVDWARLDCAAVLEALDRREPQLPICWLGHSLGGQILPFVPNWRRLRQAIMIATGSGYWRDAALPLRRYVWWLWYVAVPLSLPLFGYFPGRRLRKLDDLPRGVMAQWRRWCLDPDYSAGAEGELVRQLYAAVDLPILSLSFSDDEYLSARSAAALERLYAGAELRRLRLDPAAEGLDAIGHFGFFRPAAGERLWPRYLLPALPPGDGSA